MHPCLRLAEIVEIIFEMLDDDRRYLGTAAALARTCRLFQDLALNIVWAFQDSLRNLLERFPEEIWRYHDRTDGLIRIGFEFITAPRPADWERVRFYAGRILTLVNSPDIHPQCYRNLRVCPGEQPLLWNLRTLHYAYYSHSYSHPRLHDPLSLIGNHLGSLTLSETLFAYRDDSTDILELARRWPGLTTLRVFDIPRDIFEQLRKLVRLLNNLRVCVLPLLHSPLDRDTLSHLASLSSLHELSAHIVPSSLPHRGSTGNGFLGLGILTLHVSSPQLCVMAAKLFQHGSLGSLDLEMVDAPSPAEFGDLVFTLLNGHVVRSLTRLVLQADYHDAGIPHSITLEAIDSFILKSLVGFQRLASITIDVGISFEQLDDDTLEEMAVAWPNLTKMDFSHHVTLHNAAKATFQGIASLVQHCPHLDFLFLPFTAIYPDPNILEKITRNGISCDRIFRLAVTGSIIGESDTDVVARLLMALFPRLTEVMYPADSLCGYEEDLENRRLRLWQKVSHTVRGHRQTMLQTVSSY